MSRVLRCFAAASIESAPTTPDAFAERDGERRIGRAAADQEHGGIAGRIGLRQRDLRFRQPAQHGGMEGAHAERGAEPRDQAVGIAAARGEGQGVLRQRARSIERHERQVGRLVGDLPGERRHMRLVPDMHRGENRGRLHLLDRARGAGPVGVDDGKQTGLVQRRNERRPLGVGHKQDRARLGHRKL